MLQVIIKKMFHVIQQPLITQDINVYQKLTVISENKKLCGLCDIFINDNNFIKNPTATYKPMKYCSYYTNIIL